MSRKWIIFGIILLAGILTVPPVAACGGLFCQNTPIDQQAERIIFTINGDNTVSAYVQINYTGSAPDFSWVVPVPSVPEVDVAEIASFDELSRLTAPSFIPPSLPDCAREFMPVPSAAVLEGAVDDVEVLAEGTAGPFAFQVVTSEDPNALITWLRTNEYRITEEMEPLVHLYTEEEQVFLAMRLLPDEGTQDIQPVVMTYEAELPSIPIRLTAVAANPNMSLLTWIFADEQAVPLNYAHPVIDMANLRGDLFGSNNGTNYLFLVDQTVDLYAGRAFITELAQPTADFAAVMRPGDPLVRELTQRFDYMTRLFGRMSPEEMTVDPVFSTDGRMRDVSNVHDLTDVDPALFWGCRDIPIEIEFDPAVVPQGF